MHKKIAYFSLALLALAACGSFSNPERGRNSEERPALIPGQGQKNPFPPGFENPNEGDFTEEKMLVNTGVNVIAKGVRSLRLQAEILQGKVESYCEALGGTGAPESAASAAQNQWRETMLAFHYVDAAPIGPLLDADRYLIDHIYAWPILDACGVDREVVRLKETRQADPNLLYTVKGLGAIEYLLFEGSLASRCHPRAYPKTKEWSDLPSAREKKLDRCRYAGQLAKDLVEKSRLLDRAWDPEEMNFTKTLIDRGERFPALKESTNALTDSLFSLEAAKDRRLGRPIGMHKDCVSDEKKCPQDAEHEWSGLGIPALVARVRGFRDVFFGSAAPGAKAFGLDDFLGRAGHPEVAAEISRDAEQAIAAGEALAAQGSLADQARALSPELCRATTPQDRKEPICAFYQDMRELTTAMKVEVLSILSLRAPPGHQGDND